MANTFLTDSVISLEALSVLENTLVAAKYCDRKYEALFGRHGGSNRSDTIRVRKPNRYTVRLGRTYAAQDVLDEFVSFPVQTQIGVDTFINSDDMAQNLSSFSDQIIKPQIAILANYIDQQILTVARQTMNVVGTPGSPANSLATFLAAGAKLDQNACPRDGQRALILGPQGHADAVSGLSVLFQSAPDLAKQYKTGLVAKDVAGFDWAMDQNVGIHTVGTKAGAGAVNGAAQTGSSLVTNGWTASSAILNQNDVFTIAGVFQVNPVSKVSNGVLQQFMVTSAVSSDGSGNATIAIYPPITVTGGQQTVSASPANAAAITVVGTASTGAANHIALHKGAIALAFAELPMPKGVDMGATKTDDQLGISMRFVRYFDGDNDRFKARFDVKFGVVVLRPEWVCRVAGGPTA